jgi:hypothetical protein
MRRRSPWLGSLALLLIAGGFVVLAQTPTDPVLTIANHHLQAVTVAVDGERVRIVRPGTEETLELPIALWAQPRTIAVTTYPSGAVLFTWRADLTDLADQHWRLIIP